VPIGIVLIILAPRYLPETERRPGRFDMAGAATSTVGMTLLVYGFVSAASRGWGAPVTLVSFVLSALLLATFVANEKRAQQPITPLHLFASRQRSGSYVARMLIVSGMFAMFFFMTQFFQGVLGYSPLASGLAFLPVTAVMFAVVRVVPRFVRRVGTGRLLAGGVLVALVGMVWLSRLSPTTPFFPQIMVPMALLGTGIGAALVPLTTAGIAGVDAEDAGAASGLVNVAQQLGGSLGLGILITVFAAAGHTIRAVPTGTASGRSVARWDLAHQIATSLKGSAVFLALAFVVVVAIMRVPPTPADPSTAEGETERELEGTFD
jgi:predicted MFS family arabinose efflux permease